MSSDSDESPATKVSVEELFKVSISSSEDPPMDQWSSLIQVEYVDNPKVAIFNEGLYDPGSGEICTKYIALSDSSVFRHVYYNYPGIKDPGILEALLHPEKRKIYDPNGQDLYLDLCKEMKLCPVRSFYRGLLERDIDLRFYCVNPVSVRAMSLALLNNPFVRRLDLTSNFLNEDACYHIGQMLGENMVLQELVLSRCKIGKESLQRLVMRLGGRSMDVLDLSYNEFGDSGFEYLSTQILKGAIIKELNLSHNSLGLEAALSYSGAIEGNNSTTNLDLSWNRFYTPKAMNDILRMLGESKVLVELNLSWNSLTTSQMLKRILGVPSLRVLNLSNNRLSTMAAKALIVGLKKSKLQVLDVSNNPWTPADAIILLEVLKDKKVKLQSLLFGDTVVSKEFVPLLQEVQSLNFRASVKVTHGMVIGNYVLSVPDMRDIVMRRLFYITNSAKKCTMDMPVYFLTKARHEAAIEPREFFRDLKLSGVVADEGLMEELGSAFPGPKTEKGKPTISLLKIVEFIQRLWPEKEPILTPPPEPEPDKKDKKKDKKDKKKK